LALDAEFFQHRVLRSIPVFRKSMCMTIYFDKLDNDLTSASVPCGLVEIAERRGIYRNFFKRALDLTLIIVFAPIVLPLIALLALIVARDGSAPFFWSYRVGKNGREFRMLKLRTMVPDAEYMLDEHIHSDPVTRAEWETTQKLKNDPRITRVGRILRKLSLDELPQLWNVLIGDMSFIGPRPEQPDFVKTLEKEIPYYDLRHLVKPGITGWAQVMYGYGASTEDAKNKLEFDLYYIKNYSLALDAYILMRTLRVVMFGTGR